MHPPNGVSFSSPNGLIGRIKKGQSPYREGVCTDLGKGARRKWGGDILMPPGTPVLCVRKSRKIPRVLRGQSPYTERVCV